METWQTEYQIANSSPEYIFEWLKEYGSQKFILASDFVDLEHTLLARNNKLINFGLALYATEPSVVYQLYQTGEHTIKRACLSGRSVKRVFLKNSWVMEHGVLSHIIANYEDEGALELLQAIFENPFLPDSVLVDLYTKNDIFADVEEDVWVCIVGLTYRNKRIATPCDDSIIDGYDEYQYNEVLHSAWRLFETIPVTTDNARMLVFLSENLVPSRPYDMDVLNVIQRWCSDRARGKSLFADVRARLVCLLKVYDNHFKKLKDSEDVALRRGYYQNTNDVTAEKIDKCFAKDGKVFLDEALYNEAYFKSNDVRERLFHACCNVEDDINRDYTNWYNVRENYLSQHHPEWFADDGDGEITFNHIKDDKFRTEKRLEALNHQTSKLYKAILGPKTAMDDEYYPDSIFTEKGLLPQLELELRDIGKQFAGLYQKSQFSVWGGVVLGVVIGFIIGQI